MEIPKRYTEKLNSKRLRILGEMTEDFVSQVYAGISTIDECLESLNLTALEKDFLLFAHNKKIIEFYAEMKKIS